MQWLNMDERKVVLLFHYFITSLDMRYCHTSCFTTSSITGLALIHIYHRNEEANFRLNFHFEKLLKAVLVVE